MQVESLTHFQSVFANNFFVAPGDADYFQARLAKIHGRLPDFFWQALQALEKYLKAGLVLNGARVKASGHDLSRLFEHHSAVFGDVAITRLVKPEKLAPYRWRDEDVGRFVDRIHHCGQPDSRYGLVSWYAVEDDLFKFDQLAFELRRRTIGLDWVVGAHWAEPDLALYAGRSYEAVLRQEPETQIRRFEPPVGPAARFGEDLSDAWYAWNFAYARADGDLTKPAPVHVAPMLGPMRNSYLSLLYDRLSRDRPHDADLVAGTRWLLDHVRLPKEAGTALRALLA